ncbi:hypothetical protein PTTG_30208 [Puccinia triticina 1-1 BBBD Race 1]|uniref:Mediator of RNA polymerase II transcription subunit 5 n=1 Tax=Puccinia triticina (isolate 1-1 / race 1 (BBBD)) TaxID=630390 RepID=A0A180G0D0_PUCT1|nr:hypothetical protein PTTG_30208 [Puccinia triticina 1-1 BBBD Race 1]
MIVNSKGQLGCLIFEVALGFRVGQTAEVRPSHLGIPSLKDQTIRLPPDKPHSQHKKPPATKLVIQFDLLSIHQLWLALNAKFDAQSRLLNYKPSGPPLPILFHHPKKTKPSLEELSATVLKSPRKSAYCAHPSLPCSTRPSSPHHHHHQPSPKTQSQPQKSSRTGPVALLASLISNYLVQPQDLPEQDGQSGSHVNLDLGLQPLLDCLGKEMTELAVALQQRATKTFDLSTCIALSNAPSVLDVLSTLFLWLEPRTILIPFRGLLNHWITIRNNLSQITASGPDGNKAGSGSGFKNFGGLLGWIQGRFSGSSGIPDALLSTTNPRIFFAIALSLFKQSFNALNVCLINLQTFRDGLSYFEHKLLIARAAVGMLDKLSRLGPISSNLYPTNLLEILKAILLLDAISATGLQLVATHLQSVVCVFAKRTWRMPAALSRLGADLNWRVQLDVDAIKQRLMVLPAAEMLAPVWWPKR